MLIRTEGESRTDTKLPTIRMVYNPRSPVRLSGQAGRRVKVKKKKKTGWNKNSQEHSARSAHS